MGLAPEAMNAPPLTAGHLLRYIAAVAEENSTVVDQDLVRYIYRGRLCCTENAPYIVYVKPENIKVSWRKIG